MFAQKRTNSLNLRHTRAHFYTRNQPKKKKKISQISSGHSSDYYLCHCYMGAIGQQMHFCAKEQVEHCLMFDLAASDICIHTSTSFG